MRVLLLFFAAVLAAVSVGTGFVSAQEKKASETLVFKSKMGDVTFHHVKHSEREKENCKACHPKLWPESTEAPLNFKAGMHKPSEAKQESCGFCHRPGGPAFAASVAANCKNCHVKPAPKK